MQRIDGLSRSASLPAPATTGAGAASPGYFGNGDPLTSTAPTTMTADWANMIQEELVAVIDHAGIALDKANHGQLLAAILAILTAALASTSGTLTNPGHLAIGGLVLQWGTATLASGANSVTGSIAFPSAFPTAAWTIVGNADGRANGSWGPITIMFDGLTLSGATYIADTANNSQSITAGKNIRWFALGH